VDVANFKFKTYNLDMELRRFFELLKPISSGQILTALTAGESVRLGNTFLIEPPSSDSPHNAETSPTSDVLPEAHNMMENSIEKQTPKA